MSKLKPGTPAPKSGQYLNPKTKTEVTGVKGKPLPPVNASRILTHRGCGKKLGLFI